MTRPSPELEAKLRRIRLVLMDIDGTLISSGQHEFGNVSAQLRKLKHLGVPFSTASGRTVAGSRLVLEKLRDTTGSRMATSINYNGAVLLTPATGTLIERHVVPAPLVQLAVNACREMRLWPLVYTCDDTVSGPPVETVHLDVAAPPTAEFNGMLTVRTPDAGTTTGDVVAILADAGSPEASNAAAAVLAARLGPALRATTSGSRYVEICAPEATKAHAMTRLAALHDVTDSGIMTIGDNLNDIEMLRAAGVGVAVGNAPAEVKAAADFACSRDSAEGVVEALRMLIRVLQLPTVGKIGDSRWRKTVRLQQERVCQTAS